MTIRVPSEKFNDAMKEIQSYGTVISANINSANISKDYQDIFEIEEVRLLDYLNQAGNLTDLLQIESELNRVRTEIDDKKTLIKNWDKKINYVTDLFHL